MTRIVFATQVVDPEDPNLGAVVGMLRALAARVDEVVVLGGQGGRRRAARATAASAPSARARRRAVAAAS